MFSARKTFIEKLRDRLSNPSLKATIQRNSGDRIFDGLPAEFDSIFSNTAADAAELGQLLKQIPANHVEIGDGHVFRFKADAEKIERWAKRRIARICHELLTQDNSIKEEVLVLLGKTNESLSARDLVRAYYAAASQYIEALVEKSEAGNHIDINVFHACIEYNTLSGSRWILSVLLDRVADPDVNYNERDTSFFADVGNSDLSMGLIGGVVGTLCVLGLAGGVAAYQIYKKRQNQAADHLPDIDTRESRSPSNGR